MPVFVAGDDAGARYVVGQLAKSAGFDVKALRQLIRIRKQEAAEVEELEEVELPKTMPRKAPRRTGSAQ